MESLFSIAGSGLNAAAARLSVAAQDTAAAPDDEPPAAGAAGPTAPTPTLSLVQFSLPDGGVGTDVQPGGPDDPIMDVVNQVLAIQAFKANVRVFQVGEAALKSVLNLKA